MINKLKYLAIYVIAFIAIMLCLYTNAYADPIAGTVNKPTYAQCVNCKSYGIASFHNITEWAVASSWDYGYLIMYKTSDNKYYCYAWDGSQWGVCYYDNIDGTNTNNTGTLDHICTAETTQPTNGAWSGYASRKTWDDHGYSTLTQTLNQAPATTVDSSRTYASGYNWIKTVDYANNVNMYKLTGTWNSQPTWTNAKSETSNTYTKTKFSLELQSSHDYGYGTYGGGTTGGVTLSNNSSTVFTGYKTGEYGTSESSLGDGNYPEYAIHSRGNACKYGDQGSGVSQSYFFLYKNNIRTTTPVSILQATAATQTIYGRTHCQAMHMMTTNYARVNGTEMMTLNYRPTKYTVSYNANGGSGTMANGNSSATQWEYGKSYNLRSNSFTGPTGKRFLGWSTDPSATTATYTNNQSVSNLAGTEGATVTLYAVWGYESYSITMNANGGTYSGTSPRTVTYGSTTNNSVGTATRTGYTFKGWYDREVGGQMIWKSTGSYQSGAYWSAGSGTATGWRYLHGGWSSRYTNHAIGTYNGYLYQVQDKTSTSTSAYRYDGTSWSSVTNFNATLCTYKTSYSGMSPLPTQTLSTDWGTVYYANIFGRTFASRGDSERYDPKSILKETDYECEVYEWILASGLPAGSWQYDVGAHNASMIAYAQWDDTSAPTASISSTNNVASSQTVTLTGSDTAGVVGYYWGTNSSPNLTDYTAVTSTTSWSTTKTVSSAGTYYLFVKDAYDNVSAVKSITFYKTTFSVTNGSTSPTSVITASGNSFATPSISPNTGYNSPGKWTYVQVIRLTETSH